MSAPGHEVCCAAPTLPEPWDPAAAYIRQAADLLAKAKVLQSFGVDDFEDGTVITWGRTYRNPTALNNREYTYVALKAGGTWWITGQRADRGLLYSSMVEEHLAHADADTIHIVAKWAVFE